MWLSRFRDISGGGLDILGTGTMQAMPLSSSDHRFLNPQEDRFSSFLYSLPHLI